jgi:hypothetical protein
LLLTGLDFVLIKSLRRFEELLGSHIEPLFELTTSEQMHRLIVHLEASILLFSLLSWYILHKLQASHELLVFLAWLEDERNRLREILQGTWHIGRYKEAQKILGEINLRYVNSVQLHLSVTR